MKKLLIITALAAIIPATAFSQQQFDGTFQTNGGFVTEAFTLPSSANVTTFYIEDTRSLAASSGHSKGSELGFGGTTNGGSIAGCTTGFETPSLVTVEEAAQQGVEGDDDFEAAVDARTLGC
jgi:hypothetical protein